MSDAIEALLKRYGESSEALPPHDPRLAAIADLEADIKSLIRIADDKCKAQRLLHELEDAAIDKQLDKSSLDALLAAKANDAILEERFYNLQEQIERKARKYNQEDHLQIFIAHTNNGMPVRVRERCKLAPWDPPPAL